MLAELGVQTIFFFHANLRFSKQETVAFLFWVTLPKPFHTKRMSHLTSLQKNGVLVKVHACNLFQSSHFLRTTKNRSQMAATQTCLPKVKPKPESASAFGRNKVAACAFRRKKASDSFLFREIAARNSISHGDFGEKEMDGVDFLLTNIFLSLF